MIEYKVESFTIAKSEGGLQDRLNELGREGWKVQVRLDQVTNKMKRGLLDGFTLIFIREWKSNGEGGWVLANQ